MCSAREGEERDRTACVSATFERKKSDSVDGSRWKKRLCPESNTCLRSLPALLPGDPGATDDEEEDLEEEEEDDEEEA